MDDILQKQLKREISIPGKTGLDWYLFCCFAKEFKDSKFLELGVGDGGSLYSLLAYSDDVTVIDNWNHGWAKYTVEDRVRELGKTVKFIDKDTDLVTTLELEQYNFIHFDAGKSYSSITYFLNLCNTIASGVVCLDDYMHSIFPEVTWAVDDFLRANPEWKVVLIGNHQIFISKQELKVSSIVKDIPTSVQGNGAACLTFSVLPKEVNPFIEGGAMRYSWQDIAWRQTHE